MSKRTLASLFTAIVLALPGTAQAGPALFHASFIMHAFGNDITSGTQPPYTAADWTGWPLGHDCQYATPYKGTPTHPVGFRYCPPSVMQAGAPATGPRAGGPSLISTTTPGAAGGISMPQSAFGIMTTGWLPTTSYLRSYLQSNTYATFVNAAGSFFAGGGPGAVTKTGMGQRAGTWIIQPGPNTFGGAMGLLGRFGAVRKYVVPGIAGTYTGAGSWNMVVALGRCFECTPTAYDKQGKTTNWLNPHDIENRYYNNINGKTSTLTVRGSGTPWTTGSVTVYATGVYTTILHRAGYDTATPSGMRNLQLVTPALTHWIGPGFQTHTGHIGILTLQVPEPGRVALLAAGIGALALLYRASRLRRAIPRRR
ncbi:MAG: hypothetical protein OEM49_03420 [Myxococcales bacterium]|nr:hypothetical protein [Myxococcales bacterium]MDH5307118.1 hypothetical protein [Myxococcales bacterium]MDH5565069.1 hypothetical protein [Myxococcales bacterium]